MPSYAHRLVAVAMFCLGMVLLPVILAVMFLRAALLMFTGLTGFWFLIAFGLWLNGGSGLRLFHAFSMFSILLIVAAFAEAVRCGAAFDFLLAKRIE